MNLHLRFWIYLNCKLKPRESLVKWNSLNPHLFRSLFIPCVFIFFSYSNANAKLSLSFPSSSTPATGTTSFSPFDQPSFLYYGNGEVISDSSILNIYMLFALYNIYVYSWKFLHHTTFTQYCLVSNTDSRLVYHAYTKTFIGTQSLIQCINRIRKLESL